MHSHPNRRSVTLWAVLASIWLVACTTTGSTDPSSINFRVPKGSVLVLNREVRIAELQSHAKFQQGEQTPGVDQYDTNCRLDQRALGPATIMPDRFLITRYSSGREWVSQPNIMRYYKVFHLRSDRQPGVFKLTCQDWDGPLLGGPVAIAEVQRALGDIFTFEFAGTAPPASR